MIQDINDIYNLIKQPGFTLPANIDATPYGTFVLSNAETGDRVDILLGTKHIEISKFHNMCSEYYETITTTNARGRAIYQRLHTILLNKHICASIRAINDYAANAKRTPYR